MRPLMNLFAATLGLTVACGDTLAVEVARTLEPVATATAPLSPAGEGRRTFLQLNCYGCHGMFAAGGMGPNIVGTERNDVREAVMRGEDGGMPSYKAYATDTDITNLTAYLRSIGSGSEPVFMDWWKKVPPK